VTGARPGTAQRSWEGSPGPGDRAPALTPHPASPGFKLPAASTECFAVALLEIASGAGTSEEKMRKKAKKRLLFEKM